MSSYRHTPESYSSASRPDTTITRQLHHVDHASYTLQAPQGFGTGRPRVTDEEQEILLDGGNVSQSQQGNYTQRYTNALGIQFLPHAAPLQSVHTSRGGVPHPTASSLRVAPGNGAGDGTILRRRMTVPPSSQPINTASGSSEPELTGLPESYEPPPHWGHPKINFYCCWFDKTKVSSCGEIVEFSTLASHLLSVHEVSIMDQMGERGPVRCRWGTCSSIVVEILGHLRAHHLSDAYRAWLLWGNRMADHLAQEHIRVQSENDEEL